MRERRQIVELWQRGDAERWPRSSAWKAPSYRRTGARLLISASGDYAGSISGGCLEAEVIRKAAWLIGDGAVVERYSTLFDDTAEIPYGLGCGGMVDVLLEPAGTPEFAALMQAMQASLHGQSFTVETRACLTRRPCRCAARSKPPTGNGTTGDSSLEIVRPQAAGTS